MAELDILIKARDATRRAFSTATKSADEYTDSLDKSGEAAGRLNKGLQIAAAGGIAAAAGGLAIMGQRALAEATELDRLTKVSGASAERLQVLAEVARESGGSAEDVADAYREMQLRLSEASQLASGPAVDAMRLLGLTFDELEGLAPDEQFDRLRDAISSVKDPADRLFAAEELLGGSSERLAAVVDLGTDAFDRRSESIENSGRVMREELVANLADAQRTLELFEARMTVWGAEVVGVLDETVEGLQRLGRNDSLASKGIRAIAGMFGADIQTDAQRFAQRFDEVNAEVAVYNERTGEAFQLTARNNDELQAQHDRLKELVRALDEVARARLEGTRLAQQYLEDELGNIGRHIDAERLAAETSVTVWQNAYQQRLRLSAEAIAEQVAAARYGLDLIAQGDTAGGGLDSASFRRHQNRQRIAQAFADVPVLGSDGSYSPRGAGRAGGGPTEAEQTQIRLLEQVADWGGLTAQQALEAAVAQKALLAQGADSDGHRTIAERQLIADAERQITSLEQILGIEIDQRTLLQRQLDELVGVADWGDLTYQQALAAAQAQAEQTRILAAADGKISVGEQQLINAAEAQIDALNRIFGTLDTRTSGAASPLEDAARGLVDYALQDPRWGGQFPRGTDPLYNLDFSTGDLVPALNRGGLVTRTGLIYAHAGEAVTPAPPGAPGDRQLLVRLELDGDQLGEFAVRSINEAIRNGEVIATAEI